MIRTTKPVSELSRLSITNQFPVKVMDKDGDVYVVKRITWIGRTCYTVKETVSAPARRESPLQRTGESSYPFLPQPEIGP
jgi:hypothetical protein